MPVAGLSGGLHPQPAAVQHLANDGGAVYPAHVGEHTDTHARHSGAIRLPQPAVGRRRARVRYGVQLPAVHDIPHLQHLAEDGPQPH